MSRLALALLCVAISFGGSPVVALGGAPTPFPGFPDDTHIGGRVDFSSPTVVDINNDGALDILLGDNAGCVWAWNLNGALIGGQRWATTNIFNDCSTDDRISGPLAVGDVDGNDGGLPEVVAGVRGINTNEGPFTPGRVYVWNNDGVVLSNWPKSTAWDAPDPNDTPEVRTVALGNLTGDGDLEVVAGTTNHVCNGCSQNLYAWDAAGILLNINFPTGYIDAGIYGAVSTGHLTGDGYAEIITGRDHRWLHAYNSSGGFLTGWPQETYATGSSGLYLEFTNNGAAIGDLDFNGVSEIIIAGKVRDPNQSGSPETNTGVMVFEPDGSRRAGTPGWTSAKIYGAPLYNLFPPSMYPALGDLDRDGKLDIVIAMADGYIRAFRENGTLMWQYDFAQGRTLYGSEPVIGDITGDGYPEIIFGTYSPNQSDGTANTAVSVIGLDRNGVMLSGFPLTLPNESSFFGVRAGPTLADLDENGDLELMVGSWGGALYVWDLANAPVSTCQILPWPTARHDNWRSGSYHGPALVPIGAAPANIQPSTLHISLGVSNTVYLPIISRC